MGLQSVIHMSLCDVGGILPLAPAHNFTEGGNSMDESVRLYGPEDLRIGDTLEICFRDHSVRGTIVRSFPASKPISDEDLSEYYGIEPGHRYYDSVSKASRFERFVVEKETGSYIVFPYSPGFFKRHNVYRGIREEE